MGECVCVCEAAWGSNRVLPALRSPDGDAVWSTELFDTDSSCCCPVFKWRHTTPAHSLLVLIRLSLSLFLSLSLSFFFFPRLSLLPQKSLNCLHPRQSHFSFASRLPALYFPTLLASCVMVSCLLGINLGRSTNAGKKKEEKKMHVKTGSLVLWIYGQLTVAVLQTVAPAWENPSTGVFFGRKHFQEVRQSCNRLHPAVVHLPTWPEDRWGWKMGRKTLI